MKKLVSLLLVLAMALTLVACGAKTEAPAAEAPAAEAEAEADAPALPYHIGIVTGSVSQAEDDPRGAQAFQAKYGEDCVKLAVYPDNFTEELETTIQTIVNMADDPEMKAIIVNQADPGSSSACRLIRE